MRRLRRAAEKERQATALPAERPANAVPVDASALAPYHSYGCPEFVARGYYWDIPFVCVDCGTEAVFTAAQQKWWYEVAKGQVYSIAKRCRACRRARKPVSIKTEAK